MRHPHANRTPKAALPSLIMAFAVCATPLFAAHAQLSIGTGAHVDVNGDSIIDSRDMDAQVGTTTRLGTTKNYNLRADGATATEVEGNRLAAGTATTIEGGAMTGGTARGSTTSNIDSREGNAASNLRNDADGLRSDVRANSASQGTGAGANANGGAGGIGAGAGVAVGGSTNLGTSNAGAGATAGSN